jgi:ankyrin repeat protein
MLSCNKLLNHLLYQNWDAALDRLARKPGDIEAPHLFLHTALQNKAPLEVVQALYKARPDAIYHREEHGYMALHVGCVHGHPIQAIEYLHLQWPQAARETCNDGRLPLHLAALSHACRALVIKFLLSVYPQGMDMEDNKGMTALRYIEHSGHPHSQVIAREFDRDPAFWIAKDLFDPKGNPLCLLICQRKWDEMLNRFLHFPEEATIWTVYKNKRLLPIHFACKYKAPLQVVTELAEVHPFGLSLTCQEYDMMPLHLACQHGASLDVVQVLLHGYAEAAAHQNELGLVPLHLACAHGANIKVIQALIEACPQAATIQDVRKYTPRVYAEASNHPRAKEILELFANTASHEQ